MTKTYASIIALFTVFGLFYGYVDISKEKESLFVEKQLMDHFLKQKEIFTSQYGSLTQTDSNVSLVNFNCLESQCSAVIKVNEKSVNTDFDFNQTNFYVPLISEVGGILKDVRFK